LEAADIQLLIAESEKLKLAGATKTLLAWSPLISLAGESNAIHAAISIQQTDWVEIGEAFSKIDQAVFISLAIDARIRANTDFLDPKVKAFWKAMADFYGDMALK
jgi:hypothetical protein